MNHDTKHWRNLLSDSQWARIAHLLPGKEGDRGRTAANNRSFVEAVLWIVRTGAPWRDLPERFGNWNSVYQRFARWSKSKVWHRLFDELSKDADFEELFLDSTIVRAHQHAAGAQKKKGDQALGRSRGGLSTKIHTIVEGLGNMAKCILTGGQVGDSTQAEPLLSGMPTDGTVKSVTADKAFDADAIIRFIEEDLKATAVVPSKSNRRVPRELDVAQYRNRNLVERFFCRIKQFRRIATRYDKLVARFASFIMLASALIWMA
jgi:transposase